MTTNCSFCLQKTDAGLLAVSVKMPAARICDKCLFKEVEKLFSQDQNLPNALERLQKEHKTVWTHVTAAVEVRVQALNTGALALDSELGELREVKRQLQDTLHSVGAGSADTGSSEGSRKSDLRSSAVRRLVDDRMNPGSVRAPEAGAPVAATGG